MPNNIIGKVVAPMMLAVVGLMMWMVASKSIGDIQYARRGSPPKDQLRRIEGTVVQWANCSHISKFSWIERVSLRSDTETINESIPCVLPVNVLSDGRPHRIEVLIRPDDGSVYNITLDGQTLLAYATVKQAVDNPAPLIRFATFTLTALLIVFVSLLWATVTVWRPSNQRSLGS